jgi:hypothetical protein
MSILLKHAIYMYYGQLGKHGPTLHWKIGLHPSSLARLSTISSCSPKSVVVGPELAIGGTWMSILLKHAIYMYYGQLGMHGLSLYWKLGLHPSSLAHLSTISSCSPKLVVLGPELGIGGTWMSILLNKAIYMYCGQLGKHESLVLLGS